MKKSIIAAGAASVALAAMPIVGAFAAPTSVTDSITANLNSGCTITNEGSGDVITNTVDINNVIPGGSAVESAQSDGISVVCNKAGWTISARGDAGNTNLTYGGATIATGTAASTATSGNSYWAFKIASAPGASIATDFDDYHVVPDTATVVVTGSALTETTIKAQYQVYANSTQAPGAYTGGVNYTVTPAV